MLEELPVALESLLFKDLRAVQMGQTGWQTRCLTKSGSEKSGWPARAEMNKEHKLKTNLRIAKIVLLAGMVTMSHAALAQRHSARRAVRLPEDILTLKQMAEANDFRAQVALGDKLSAIQHYADALTWYRKASLIGCTEATYQVGRMLLYGAASPAAGQTVKANPNEGVRSMYRAATNLHTRAFRDLSGAYHQGLGVEKNWIEAYAWLRLFADADASVGRTELEALSLKMTTRDVEAGRQLAKQFKSRRWSKLAVSAAAIAPLRLDGVTSGGNTPLVVVNHRSLAQGESATIPVNGRMIEVKCVEIQSDSVLIEVEGESEPRWLRFESNVAINSVRP